MTILKYHTEDGLLYWMHYCMQKVTLIRVLLSDILAGWHHVVRVG